MQIDSRVFDVPFREREENANVQTDRLGSCYLDEAVLVSDFM